MLEIRNLNVKYGDIQVLWDVNLWIRENSFVGLLGANGAGKSTLARTIVGLLPAVSGEILFEGENILGLSTTELVKRGIVLTPDERNVFPSMTVRENLMLGGYTVKDKKLRMDMLDYVMELYPILKKRLAQTAGSLSGGEQQMLAIGKALISKPKLLILDEPSSGLAPVIIDKMFSALRLIADNGITVLLIEQNVMRTLEIGDYAFFIENGRMVKEGKSKDLMQHDDIKKMYLGI